MLTKIKLLALFISFSVAILGSQHTPSDLSVQDSRDEPQATSTMTFEGPTLPCWQNFAPCTGGFCLYDTWCSSCNEAPMDAKYGRSTCEFIKVYEVTP